MSEGFKKTYIFKNPVKKVFFTEVASSRLIDENLEKILKQKWKERQRELKQKKVKIWESLVYRLEEILQNNEELHFKVSTIPFSARLMMNDFSEVIRKKGIAYAPLGLFSSCFVLTKDNYYVFIEKSKRYHFDRNISLVGGVISKTENQNANQMDIFKEVRKELREEIGIISDHVDSNILIACYINDTFNFCFLIKIILNLSKDEVLSVFSNKLDEEADNIIFVHENDLEKFVEKILHVKDNEKFLLLKKYDRLRSDGHKKI